MLRRLTATALVLLSASFGFGQKKEPAANPPALDNSQAVTKRGEQLDRLHSALLSEKPHLSLPEVVALYASLAKIWKDEQPIISRKYLQDAIGLASPAMADGSKEKDEKIALLRRLLSLSEQIDPKLTDQIIKQLKSESEGEPRHRLQNSNALADAALAVVSSQPKLAFEMAIAALEYVDRPSENEKLFSIVLFLARQDKKFSENLLLRVFEVAQRVDDLESIATLALYTSPKSTTLEIDFLSDNSKKYVLSGLIERLTQLSVLAQQNQLPQERRDQACRLNTVARGLLPVISSYLPNQTGLAPQLDQLSTLCQQGGSPSPQSWLNELSKDGKELTVDELIQVAEDSINPQKKAFFFTVAIGKLSKEKKFERAVELFDGMNEETRRAMGTDNDDSFWRGGRQATALNAVLQRLETQDFSGARRLIDKTPGKLLPELELQVSQAVLRKVSTVDASNPMQSFAFDLVDDARRKLPAMDDTIASVNLYLGLLTRYATLVPDETILIFKEAVKAINRADDGKDQDKTSHKDFAGGNDIITLPPVLLEQEDVIGSYVRDIQKPYTRVRIRLGLLNACLNRYRDEKSRAPQKVSSGRF